jgi:SAM-dependent methyltransferase
MMRQARLLDQPESLQIDYCCALAEQVGLKSGWADLVSAGQCWHWFERSQAALEVWRLLRPGGRALITHFDWIPSPGNLAESTEELIFKHNPGWAQNPAWVMGGKAGIYPAWLADLSTVGFNDLTTFSFDLDVPYSPEAWRGRIRASAGVGASLPPEAVDLFDAELSALLQARFPGESLLIPHRVWGLVGVKG